MNCASYYPRCLLLLLTATTSGCAGLLTEAIVSTPNRLNPLIASVEDLPGSPQMLGLRERFMVPVRSPEPAEIAVSIADPPRTIAEPRGTVMVIHGIRAQGLWMRGIAGELAKTGFRVVFVDLRGHGASTGDTLTFGPHEARDLTQVIDEVAARGLLVGDLGVFGHSYGATTSIHLAAIDPRVKAVVATAPFADMRDEVPHYVRTVLPGLGHLLSNDSYNAIIDEAGRRGNFDPEEAQAEQAITHVTAPVLLLHGLDDLVVPPDNSARIRAAAPEITTLELVPHTGHFGIWYDSDGRVAKRATQWFEQHLTVAEASSIGN